MHPVIHSELGWGTKLQVRTPGQTLISARWDLEQKIWPQCAETLTYKNAREEHLCCLKHRLWSFVRQQEETRTHRLFTGFRGLDDANKTMVVLKRGLGSKFLTEKSIRWPNSYLKTQIKVNVMLCDQHNGTFQRHSSSSYLIVLLLPQIFEFR